jgi:CRISPR-associated protein Cmr2
MQHLFVVSIGPVQEFIASARRSRDLWFGSWLLSEMSKAAAKEIVRTNGLESLIFPFPQNVEHLEPGSLFNVSNKIVALVLEYPEEMGGRVLQAINGQLETIKNGAYRQIQNAASSIRIEVANAQVKDLVEYFWSAVPFTGSEGVASQSYSATRRSVEDLLAARKVTHDFNQVKGSDAPKSSLDGKRESVIPEEAYDKLSEKQLRTRYGVRPGERLCGVGLLKRHGSRGEGDRFFSTSHVASLPFLDRLTAADKPAVDAYVDRLLELGINRGDLGRVPGEAHPAFDRYDGHILFEERLQEFFDAEADTQQARQALRGFLRSTTSGKRPMPYYALLMADGDFMSRLIDRQQTPEAHRALSLGLASFASNVRTIVEVRHGGSLVYAGGDDVLAFLPLHKVLRCARALYESFKEQLKSFDDLEHPFISLSAGLVIVHHMDPLSDALALARNSEKRAKSLPDKNALAVTVSKRSGVDKTVFGKWGTLDNRLEEFTSLLRKDVDAVPDNAAFQLRDLALRLMAKEGFEEAHTLDEAMRFEAVRILQRKRSGGGRRQIDPAVSGGLERLINSPDISIRQLADELIIARTFAEAADLAESA